MSVVNVRVKNIRPRYQDLEEWMKNPKNVYVGRRGVVIINGRRFPPKDSMFANPFKIDTDNPREIVIKKYKKYIIEKIKNDENYETAFLNLKGKNLGCWCAPEPCHADVLMKLLDNY